MAYEQLKLENQLCFPIYAASRLITREYQPHLDRLGITYPQYLVLLVLWETDNLTVNEIAHRLILNTNTITPVLKRMEAQGLISRQRLPEDERKVLISLSDKGKELRNSAAEIPEKLAASLKTQDVTLDDLLTLKTRFNSIIGYLKDKDE
jgi:DNA-binding MarR family transcriptional regulator